jgi:NAD(P)-dependent dehydrogenase (short-subunit alcohol dehydrogenase family)
MEGKVCIVTGANRGVGRITAEGLARAGAKVVLVCRDRASGEAARAEIASRTGSSGVRLMVADLASQKSIRSFVDEFRRSHDRLDVLVNNAGAHFRKRERTEDGIEATFAVNHLAYFLLTRLLADMLEASAPSRIVNVASEAHRRCADLDDPQSESGYRGFRAYCKSKLANVLFTYELARRLGGTNITANCLHPGVVRTGLLRSIVGAKLVLRPLRFLLRPFTVSPEEGADTVLFLATSAEVDGISGKYFIKRTAVKSSDFSYDEIAANQLWELSSRLTRG